MRLRAAVPERSQPDGGRAAQSGVPATTTSASQPPSFWREASARSCSLTPANPAHGCLSRRQPPLKPSRSGGASANGWIAGQTRTSR